MNSEMESLARQWWVDRNTYLNNYYKEGYWKDNVLHPSLTSGSAACCGLQVVRSLTRYPKGIQFSENRPLEDAGENVTDLTVDVEGKTLYIRYVTLGPGSVNEAGEIRQPWPGVAPANSTSIPWVSGLSITGCLTYSRMDREGVLLLVPEEYRPHLKDVCEDRAHWLQIQTEWKEKLKAFDKPIVVIEKVVTTDNWQKNCGLEDMFDTIFEGPKFHNAAYLSTRPFNYLQLKILKVRK